MTFKISRLVLLIPCLLLSLSIYGQRKDYALIFAADNYENLDNLNTIEDAKEMGDILSTKYGFEVEVVEDFTNLQVMTKIREYFAKSYGEYDQLLVYFAGHGYFDIVFKQGFIACSNSDPESDNFETYVAFETLKNLLNRIPCEHVMITLNTDYARYIDPEMVGDHWVNDPVEINTESDSSEDDLIAAMLAKRTRLFLANGSDQLDEAGYENFHEVLMNILESDGGDDGIVDVSDMTTIMKKSLPVPRAGGFGADIPGSNFLLIAK